MSQSLPQISDSPAAIAEALVVNPYYAVTFNPGLFGEHEPSVTEEQWIAANRKLLKKVGDERYLRLLLDVLKGVDPVTTQQAELAELFEASARTHSLNP